MFLCRLIAVVGHGYKDDSNKKLALQNGLKTDLFEKGGHAHLSNTILSSW